MLHTTIFSNINIFGPVFVKIVLRSRKTILCGLFILLNERSFLRGTVGNLFDMEEKLWWTVRVKKLQNSCNGENKPSIMKNRKPILCGGDFKCNYLWIANSLWQSVNLTRWMLLSAAENYVLHLIILQTFVAKDNPSTANDWLCAMMNKLSSRQITLYGREYILYSSQFRIYFPIADLNILTRLLFVLSSQLTPHQKEYTPYSSRRMVFFYLYSKEFEVLLDPLFAISPTSSSAKNILSVPKF